MKNPINAKRNVAVTKTNFLPKVSATKLAKVLNKHQNNTQRV